MSHYFIEDKTLKSHIRDINISINDKNVSLRTDSGVFSNKSADRGTIIFIKSLLKLNLKGRVLDLGCGYGAVGILLKLFNQTLDITYTDINPKCIELTSFNLKRYDLDGKCLQSDGCVNVCERFDFIVFNPPISIGKERIYKIYSGTKDHLTKGGKLYLVIRKDKGALSHMKYLESIGYKATIKTKDDGYFVIECFVEGEI